MKTSYYKIPLTLLLALLVFCNPLYAEKTEKNIAKSFNISSDTRINISNKFGDVIIKRWDKNVLDLKVNIEADGKSEAKTQKILDAINVDISDRISSGSLSIETEIDDINGNGNFRINYEISMPITNPMRLTNSFGNVYLGSYKGDLELEVTDCQAESSHKRNHLHLAI